MGMLLFVHYVLSTQHLIHNCTQNQYNAYPIQGKVYEFVGVCADCLLLAVPSPGESATVIPSHLEDVVVNMLTPLALAIRSSTSMIGVYAN